MLPFIIFLCYLAAVSVFAVAITVHDKKIAVKNGNGGKPKRRIPERTLFLVAAAGGSAAMYITMKKIRHKTQHRSFMLGLPAIMAAQVLLLAALIILV